MMIQNDVLEAIFLDLYSGSGAIGIEALSRGAKEAYFVEFNRKALACIKKNLEKTRLDKQGVVLGKDVRQAIGELEKKNISFDIIFADPPYRKGYEEITLNYLKNSNILKKESLIIIESALETEIDYVDENYFEIQKVKTYKTNKHIFLTLRNM